MSISRALRLSKQIEYESSLSLPYDQIPYEELTNREKDLKAIHDKAVELIRILEKQV